MKNIRFGIAGIKHFHILEFAKGMNQLPGSEFVGFYEDDTVLRKTYEQEFGVKGFADLDSFVDATNPEVVGVAVENGKKSEVITRLVSMGCHVLADKHVRQIRHSKKDENAMDLLMLQVPKQVKCHKHQSEIV